MTNHFCETAPIFIRVCTLVQTTNLERHVYPLYRKVSCSHSPAACGQCYPALRLGFKGPPGLVLVRLRRSHWSFFVFNNSHISRPTDDAGHHVTPSSLVDHRKDHQFRAPCCLCAENDVTPNYTESTIYIAITRPHFGEYMAGCALDQCGYLSKWVSSF